jgi:transposase InsO family protein
VAYCWAELLLTPRNPSARWTSELARRVAADLKARGWSLDEVMSDDASEFRSTEFEAAVARVGARHLFIRAGRPQTNGVVERVQETILDECWKRAFARYLIPKYTGLRLDLDRYLAYKHRPRAHRAVDEGPHPRGGHREGEDVVSLGPMRRQNSVTGQVNASGW